jgi:hypothetical protein
MVITCPVCKHLVVSLEIAGEMSRVLACQTDL